MEISNLFTAGNIVMWPIGTALGLINSFASLNIGDVGGTKTTGVTSGISEALVSTASGLLVTIFTLLFANSFWGLYQR